MTKINTFANPFTSLTDNSGNKYDVVQWEANAPHYAPNSVEYTFTCRLAVSPNLIIEELHKTVTSKNTRIASLESEIQSLRDRINNASEALEGSDDD